MSAKKIKRRPFLAVSADLFDDPDIEPLPWDDRAFFIAMGCRSRQLRTDGWLTEAQVLKIGYPRWKRAIRLLADLGLVTEHTDAHGRPAWYLPGYLKWNWSQEQWTRREHEGVLGACKLRHTEEPPCERDRCQEAALWLTAHPVTTRSP